MVSAGYSPDLLLIEMAIANVMEGLRREGARDEQRLESAIMQTLPAVSAADAQGFLAACGYPRRHDQSQSL